MSLTLNELKDIRAELLNTDVPNEDLVETVGAEIERLEAVSDSTLIIYTDGAARPTNPGPAGIGAVAYIGETDTEVFIISEYIGRSTNNVAEYLAVVQALRRAVDEGYQHVHVRSDSDLVVKQVQGRNRCNSDSLLPLLGRVRGLAERFKSFSIEWIPREKNRMADGLSVAGAHKTKDCGACRHDWHVAFCTAPGIEPGISCGCPYGFRGGIDG